MLGSFEINRHALQIHTPIRSDGDVDCVNNANERKYPKLDYSKGFPDWWWLSRTDISVPSQHVQEGKRYAAEVTLAHFYEIDHYKNKLGHVSIFMQDYEGQKPWPFLDKLICQFRKAEEDKRKACNLPPSPIYKMCELYRGQVRTQADLEYGPVNEDFPTRAPLPSPAARPIQDFGGDPPDDVKPLRLCQGDCDFDSDCANGLRCHRRSAFDAIPGCIGGLTDDSNSDYCVFDPYGDGYFEPTPAPTPAPTVTARPSYSPLPLRALTDYGGTPDESLFPLQICEGDCDRDSQCAEGLYCFQRNQNDEVPGCIGGKDDIQKTDYCVFDPYGPGYTLPDTEEPTKTPTATPSSSPTATLSSTPTATPTSSPTATPASSPTATPTSSPTATPTSSPTATPTSTPTATPTSTPTFAIPSPPPSQVHSVSPSSEPTETPLSGKVEEDLVALVNFGWSPEKNPLEVCQGDCDTDGDCAQGLRCFQRFIARTAVPGCTGGEAETLLTDYCISSEDPLDGIIGEETEVPTQVPSLLPSSEPTETPLSGKVEEDIFSLVDLGWSPSNSLGLCEGDCDDDDDCEQGLRCFQRFFPKTAVPGCVGGEEDLSWTDYCVVDEAADDTAPESSPEPTYEPSPESLPSPTHGPSPKPSLSPTHGPSPKPSPDPTHGPSPKPSPSPTHGPSPKPSPDPTHGPSPKPSPDPTHGPSPKPSPQPTTAPSEAPVQMGPTVPPAIDCEDYEGTNYGRMCKDQSCCDNPRSSSNFCHEQYAILGDAVASACHHCCAPAKEVGPPAAPNPAIETFECDTLENAERMCKNNGCCEESISTSSFCREQDALHPNDLDSICVSVGVTVPLPFLL
jgi:hypothetical protein